MARKIYTCYNKECDINNIVQFENEEHICPKCSKELKINIIESMKKISIDRVPDGYESNLLKETRSSAEGVAKEANFLAGESDSGY